MFYFIDQIRTPFFPIGLVKSESNFIVTLVETGLGGWMLVVAVISVILSWHSKTWPVTLRIQEQKFSGCTLLHNSQETEFGSSDQEASPSAGKNTGVVLVTCCTWKSVPTAISGGVDISGALGCHLLRLMSFQWGLQKITSRIAVSWTHSLTF